MLTYFKSIFIYFLFCFLDLLNFRFVFFLINNLSLILFILLFFVINLLCNVAYAANGLGDLEPEAGKVPKNTPSYDIVRAGLSYTEGIKDPSLRPFLNLSGTHEQVSNVAPHLIDVSNRAKPTDIIIPTKIYSPTENVFILNPLSTKHLTSNDILNQKLGYSGVFCAKVIDPVSGHLKWYLFFGNSSLLDLFPLDKKNFLLSQFLDSHFNDTTKFMASRQPFLDADRVVYALKLGDVFTYDTQLNSFSTYEFKTWNHFNAFKARDVVRKYPNMNVNIFDKELSTFHYYNVDGTYHKISHFENPSSTWELKKSGYNILCRSNSVIYNPNFLHNFVFSHPLDLISKFLKR